MSILPLATSLQGTGSVNGWFCATGPTRQPKKFQTNSVHDYVEK